MSTWWQGTRLVARRGLVENLRSRSFKSVTALLLLLSVAAVTIPQLLGGQAQSYTLAIIGKAPAPLVAALNASGKSADFTVKYVSRPDAAAVRRAVRDGDADAGRASGTLYTSTQSDATFPGVVVQAVVTMDTSRALKAARLSPKQVAELQSIRPPKQVVVGKADDAGRAGAGFAVGIILYLALTFAGNAIANTVAMEKSTRISEVLLAILRPSQVLVGTVIAVGLATFAQLLVLAAPLAVAVQITDKIGLPTVASGDIGLAVAWFLLGFALYAFLFAATAALVNKVTEVSSATMPVTIILILGYLLAVTIVPADPNGPWSVGASIFPLTAPLAMPTRWATGDVPIWQLMLAMALTAATALLLVALASAIYRRALLITGRRVKLREVVSRRAGS
ncbi:MAG: type transport system permease protein [Actinomycetota bacterium]|jgi:ABC-2 type transport system permease protein|nr:type transport system permease protein [Actinomycetota bacterium]